VPIGPLTNVADLIQRGPEVTGKIARIQLMGGNLAYFLEDQATAHSPEYNVASDPEASRTVFESGLPLTMVGLDVTLDVQLSVPMRDQVLESERPLCRALAEIHPFWPAEQPVLHDPLTVAACADDSLITWVDRKVVVDKSGRTLMLRSNEPTVRAAVAVDAERFLRYYVETVAGNAG